MTIANELQALQTNLDNSYTAVSNKGGTLPASQNFDNLATAISSIPTGTTPTLITKNITSNGTYNASSDNADGYSSVTVNVSGSSSTKYGLSLDEILGDTNANGVLQAPTDTEIDLVFTGVQDIADNALANAFKNWEKVKTVSFPNLVAVSGSEAMSGAFEGNTICESASFPNLVQIGTNSASNTNRRHFYRCFNGDSNLKTLIFEKLEVIYCTGSASSYGTFYQNNKIEKMYFYKLHTITYGTGASTTNQNACKNIFASCSALTEIHFAAANKTAIEATAGYSTKWGATNATIYFDL